MKDGMASGLASIHHRGPGWQRFTPSLSICLCFSLFPPPPLFLSLYFISVYSIFSPVYPVFLCRHHISFPFSTCPSTSSCLAFLSASFLTLCCHVSHIFTFPLYLSPFHSSFCNYHHSLLYPFPLVLPYHLPSFSVSQCLKTCIPGINAKAVKHTHTHTHTIHTQRQSVLLTIKVYLPLPFSQAGS